MGTRNLTKIVSDGDVVVAQYGQWDGYPAGQGITAFNFLKSLENRNALIWGLQKIYYPNQQEIEEIFKPFAKVYDMGRSFEEKYPSLSRNTCAGILQVIAEAKDPVPIRLDTEFEEDTLFCEAVYEINLDYGLFVSYWDRNTESPEWGKKVVLSFDSLAHMDNEAYLKLFQNEDELV